MTNQRSPRHQSRRRIPNRGERGQGLVELGMLLPLFLVIIVGVIEVSSALNTYVTLVDAARDGARLGAKNIATDTQIRDLVMVETGRLRDPVQAADVSVSHVQIDGEDAIKVQVCNDRSLLLSVPLIMPDSFRMCSTTTMRVLGS